MYNISLHDSLITQKESGSAAEWLNVTRMNVFRLTLNPHDIEGQTIRPAHLNGVDIMIIQADDGCSVPFTILREFSGNFITNIEWRFQELRHMGNILWCRLYASESNSLVNLSPRGRPIFLW